MMKTWNEATGRESWTSCSPASVTLSDSAISGDSLTCVIEMVEVSLLVPLWGKLSFIDHVQYNPIFWHVTCTVELLR